MYDAYHPNAALTSVELDRLRDAIDVVERSVQSTTLVDGYRIFDAYITTGPPPAPPIANAYLVQPTPRTDRPDDDTKRRWWQRGR